MSKLVCLTSSVQSLAFGKGALITAKRDGYIRMAEFTSLLVGSQYAPAGVSDHFRLVAIFFCRGLFCNIGSLAGGSTCLHASSHGTTLTSPSTTASLSSAPTVSSSSCTSTGLHGDFFCSLDVLALAGRTRCGATGSIGFLPRMAAVGALE